MSCVTILNESASVQVILRENLAIELAALRQCQYRVSPLIKQRAGTAWCHVSRSLGAPAPSGPFTYSVLSRFLFDVTLRPPGPYGLLGTASQSRTATPTLTAREPPAGQTGIHNLSKRDYHTLGTLGRVGCSCDREREPINRKEISINRDKTCRRLFVLWKTIHTVSVHRGLNRKLKRVERYSYHT